MARAHTKTKSEVVVQISIGSGTVSPAQLRKFRAAFARLLAKASEAKNE